MGLAIIVGSILGLLSGLGTGGGSLLIIYLTMLQGWNQNDARLVNLMFFIPAAVIASCFCIKQGKLPVKKVLPGMIGACVSAFIFSYIARSIHPMWIKKLFGILLVATGAREICYRERKRR